MGSLPIPPIPFIISGQQERSLLLGNHRDISVLEGEQCRVGRGGYALRCPRVEIRVHGMEQVVAKRPPGNKHIPLAPQTLGREAWTDGALQDTGAGEAGALHGPRGPRMAQPDAG